MSLDRPRVYLASKLRHAPMWRDWKDILPINVVSTWHDIEKLDENDHEACRINWHANRAQLLWRAEHLIVYAEPEDHLNGTLVEIGLAASRPIPVYLTGGFDWGTWRHLPSVAMHPSLHDILLAITKGPPS